MPDRLTQQTPTIHKAGRLAPVCGAHGPGIRKLVACAAFLFCGLANGQDDWQRLMLEGSTLQSGGDYRQAAQSLRQALRIAVDYSIFRGGGKP